jgi:hypothetical protein
MENQSVLFQNSICWLLRCAPCLVSDINLTLAGPSTTLSVGDTFSIFLKPSQAGECDASGVIITNLIPPGFQLQDVQLSRGRWTFNDPVLSIHLGQLNSATIPRIEIQMKALRPGTFTNAARISANVGNASRDNDLDAISLEVVGNVGPPSLEVRRIDSTKIQVTAMGPPIYKVLFETSINLIDWKPTQTNQFGVDGSAVWTLQSPEPVFGQPNYFIRARLSVP